MELNARKYILGVGNIVSHGIGVTGSTEECSLLNSFSVTTGTTTCSFAAITTDDLKGMTVPDYSKRVGYFLEYVGIQGGVLKNHLFTGSTFNDPTCDIICKLNSDFLVYRFLTGVRVVNVGEANGVVEYQAYPNDEDPSGYAWQTSGTFLGLDLAKTYIFRVRDNLSSEIICEYAKEISLPILLPSTTLTQTPLLIGLDEVSRLDIFSTCYVKTIPISTPPIVIGQAVNVDYVATPTAFGGGESCVALFCKRPADANYVLHRNITNTDSVPISASFTMDHETSWCYGVTANAPYCGASADSEFCLTAVNGLGTALPSIDIVACSVSISKCAAPVNVTASTNTTSSSSSGGIGYKSGVIVFDNPIPEGNCMNVTFCTHTNVSGPGDAVVTLKCKPEGSGALPVTVSTTFGSQTCHPEIMARYGDEISYFVNGVADSPGTEVCAEFCISELSGSYGVNAYICPTEKHVELHETAASTPITVSVCSQNNTTTTPLGVYAEMDGYINAPGMSTGEYVIVNLCMNVQRPHGFATLQVSCQPDGSTGYVAIRTMSVTDDETITFNIHPGDSVCYSGEASPVALGGDALAWGYLCLDSVSGVGGISASINPTTAKQCDCVAAYDAGI